MQKLNKQFTSEIDEALSKFDEQNARSPAQQAEFDKYQQIYAKRDEASVETR